MKKHGIFLFVLALVTSLFVVALIIYGFDIKNPGSRKALANTVKNEGKTNYYYGVNETFAFGTDIDEEYDVSNVWLTTYTRNYVPFCFFCGWNQGDPDDDRGISDPYRHNEWIYGIEAMDGSYMDLPAGAYPTFNTKLNEFGHVMDLNEITENATAETNRVTPEWVAANYGEISYSGPDDEDCQIAFAALTICYIILAIWGLVILIGKFIPRKRPIGG